MGSLAMNFISVMVLEQTLQNEFQKPDICLISPWELNTKIHRDRNEIKIRVGTNISENPLFLRVSLITLDCSSDH